MKFILFKKETLLIFLFGVLTINTAAQINLSPSDMERMDTIYVNDNTSYLLFDHDVYAFGVSNETDFSGIAYKNSLQIRARTRRGGTVSSVFITFGDSTYTQYKYCILKYDPFQMNEFYDFRNDYFKYKMSDVQRRKENQMEELEQEDIFIAELKTRSRNILNMPNEMDMGNTLNNLSLICRLIRIDNEYAYIKFEYINQSAIDFEFEKVSFQYEEQYKQGFLKRKKLRYIDVFPIVKPDYLRINAYQNKEVVYVIPTYGLEEKEAMVVTFREKRGGRNIDLRIDSDIIANSKLLF